MSDMQAEMFRYWGLTMLEARRARKARCVFGTWDGYVKARRISGRRVTGVSWPLKSKYRR